MVLKGVHPVLEYQLPWSLGDTASHKFSEVSYLILKINANAAFYWITYLCGLIIQTHYSIYQVNYLTFSSKATAFILQCLYPATCVPTHWQLRNTAYLLLYGFSISKTDPMSPYFTNQKTMALTRQSRGLIQGPKLEPQTPSSPDCPSRAHPTVLHSTSDQYGF